MPSEEFPRLHVAVALILDDAGQKFLWTWNPRWRAFSLASSKVYPWQGVRGSNMAAAARDAAERAAAEAIGVPVVVTHARSLAPILERSGRDGRIKSYQYEAFRAGPHDRFAGRLDVRQPHVWLSGFEALSGDFRPLAASSVKVIGQLTEAGLVPGRHQLVSSVLLVRGPDDAPEFLMTLNPDWGYSLPAKRRAAGESAADAAARVAAEELGLRPDATFTLRPASGAPVAYHDHSDSAAVPTYYVHAPFTATLHDGAKLSSKEPLAWITLADIVAGSAAAPRTPAGDAGRPGDVSRTARRVLEALGYF